MSKYLKPKQSIVALTINHEEKTNYAKLKEFLAFCDQLQVKITIFSDMTHYFNLKKNNPKQKAQIDLLWEDAIQKGHDIQLLISSSINVSFIQKSKKALELLLKPINPNYQVIAFRLINTQNQSYKEVHDILVSQGIYCSSSIHAGGKTFPFAYSNHQPYFANPYDLQLRAPSSEKTLVELPIFNLKSKKTWSINHRLAKDLKCHLQKRKRRKSPKKNIIIQRIKKIIEYYYFKLACRLPIINIIIPQRLVVYFFFDCKFEKQMNHNYFVSDGKFSIPMNQNIKSLKKQVTLLTLSQMAEKAQKELMQNSRKDTIEEAEYQVEGSYHAVMGEDRNEVQSSYLQNMIPWDRETVLDFGCGSGYWTKRIAQIYPWISKAVGIDYGHDFIKKANERYKNAQISFVKENFEHMSFDNESFDCVYADATLEHAFDVNRALQEIYRILIPGGVLVALIPSDARNPQRNNPCHTWKTIPDETRMRLEDNGFNSIEIKEINIYKTFSMVPYPPANSLMMFVRAWKLPRSSSNIARVLHAMNWVSQADISKLSLIKPSSNHASILSKLLKREGYPTLCEKDKVYITIKDQSYILDPLNNRYSLKRDPLKWIMQ